MAKKTKRSGACAHYLVDAAGKIHGRGAKSKTALARRAKRLARQGIKVSAVQLCGTDRRRAVRKGGLGGLAGTTAQHRSEAEASLQDARRSFGEGYYLDAYRTAQSAATEAAWVPGDQDLRDDISRVMQESGDYVRRGMPQRSGRLRGLAGPGDDSEDPIERRARERGRPRWDSPPEGDDYFEEMDRPYRSPEDVDFERDVQGLGAVSARRGRTQAEHRHLIARRPTSELETMARGYQTDLWQSGRADARAELAERDRLYADPSFANSWEAALPLFERPKSPRDAEAYDRQRARGHDPLWQRGPHEGGPHAYETEGLSGLRAIPSRGEITRYRAGSRRRARGRGAIARATP